jgi:hypothetical protein
MKKMLYLAALVGLLAVILTMAQAPAPAGTMVLVQTLTPRVDVFREPSKVYTLSAAPAVVRGSLPMVYVNGLLMCSPDDYRLAGTVLTFTGQQTDEMDLPIIQVLYWAVAQ